MGLESGGLWVGVGLESGGLGVGVSLESGGLWVGEGLESGRLGVGVRLESGGLGVGVGLAALTAWSDIAVSVLLTNTTLLAIVDNGRGGETAAVAVLLLVAGSRSVKILSLILSLLSLLV